ncbi:MAG: hypothetical protein OXG78_11515 [Chloroflexi bacterium]|nr:hypothetical protein [Chloroflexota bacterium]
MDAKYMLAFTDADDAPYALAASPEFARDGICFAACGSGLYRSQNGGERWELLRTSSESVTTAVAVSPAFEQDRSVFAAVKGGVLRSSDGGETWFTTPFAAPPPLFSSLIASPNFERDGFLLASTLEDGVFSSSDRGLRWQPWNFGLFDLNVLCLALSPAWIDDETVYAGTETGLYRSTNGGRAWRHTGFPAEFPPVLCMTCIDDRRNGVTRILVGTEGHGMLASWDWGEAWERVATDLISGAVNQLHVRPYDAGGLVVFALAEDGILYSDDAGRSWTKAMHTTETPTAMLPLADGILLGVQGRGVQRLSSLCS